MERENRLLDVVALNTAMPEIGLARGQVGTVVEVLAPNVFEVEFADGQGRAYGLVPVRGDQLMLLHFQPTKVA
jgi:hypothetical protein